MCEEIVCLLYLLVDNHVYSYLIYYFTFLSSKKIKYYETYIIQSGTPLLTELDSLALMEVSRGLDHIAYLKSMNDNYLMMNLVNGDTPDGYIVDLPGRPFFIDVTIAHPTGATHLRNGSTRNKHYALKHQEALKITKFEHG